jgi:hypothetical protein
MACNHYRYLLILLYMERLFPLLLCHFHLVNTNKGYDLQNLGPTDLQGLPQSIQYSSSFHIHQELVVNSSSFHSFLRKQNTVHYNPHVIHHILKYFFSFIKTSSLISTSSSSSSSASTHNTNSGGSAFRRKGKQDKHLQELQRRNQHRQFSYENALSIYENDLNYSKSSSSYLRIVTYHNTPLEQHYYQFHQKQQQLQQRSSSSSSSHHHNNSSGLYSGFQNEEDYSHHYYLYSFSKSYTLIDIIIKQIILEFIYHKRLSYLDKMDINNPLNTNFHLDLSDIKSFLSGSGYDPLSIKLEEMQKKQDIQFLQQKKTSATSATISSSVNEALAAYIHQNSNLATSSSSPGKNNSISEAAATTKTITTDQPLPDIHTYKYSQLIMLFLHEITLEEFVKLFIKITEVLQLVPNPYLNTNNYNHAYVQLLNVKSRKHLPSQAVTSSHHNHSLDSILGGGNDTLSSFDQSQQPDGSGFKNRRITTQKSSHQSLLAHQNPFYEQVYEFFHSQQIQQRSATATPSHGDRGDRGDRSHLSSAASDNNEKEQFGLGGKRSREGSTFSHRSGSGSDAGGLDGGIFKGLSSTGNGHQQMTPASLRTSLLAQRQDLHRMSFMVSHQKRNSHHGPVDTIARRKTSIIPENQRKYVPNRKAEADSGSEEDSEEEDNNRKEDGIGKSVNSLRRPSRPGIGRKPSIRSSAAHRKLI